MKCMCSCGCKKDSGPGESSYCRQCQDGMCGEYQSGDKCKCGRVVKYAKGAMEYGCPFCDYRLFEDSRDDD